MAMQSDLQGLEMTIQSDFEEKKYSASPSIASPIASPIDGIANGWYTIQNVKSGLVFDIEGTSKNKGKQIQLSENNRTPSQTFFIQKSDLDGKYYTIKNKGSGLFLQIKTGIFTFKEGAALQQYPQNNSKESQQFTFIEVDENIYNIETKCNNKYIDIAGSPKVGARVQQYTPRDTRSQTFRIIPVKTANQMASGWYTIQNINSELVLEVPQASKKKGKPIIQSKDSKTDSQAFYIEKINDKYYSIKNEGSGLYLAILNQNDRTKLIQYPRVTDQDSQQFTFLEIDKDVYYIQSKISDKYIDVPNGSKKTGVKLQQLTPKIFRTYSQQFRIVPAEDGRSKTARGFLEKAKEKVINFAMKQMKDFHAQMELLSPIMKHCGFAISEIQLVIPPEIHCTVTIKKMDKNWDELGLDTDKLNKMGKIILMGMRNIDKARRKSPLQLNSFKFGLVWEKIIPKPKFEFNFAPQLTGIKGLFKSNKKNKKPKVNNKEEKMNDIDDDTLPSGWTKRVDNNGKVFYQNDITKTTQWTKPTIS